MNNELYELRPIKIIQKLESLLRPLRYALCFDQQGMLYSIKKGDDSKPCPYFYKDRRNKIYMKLGHHINRCIDKESDEWLAYYAYKIITKGRIV